MDTDSLTRGLLQPEAYPHRVGSVGFQETHISLLFFAGDRVYKVKKPVDLGFLDYTSLNERRRFCEEELRLNRRLAPWVYLGIAGVVEGEGGRLRVVDRPREEEVVEWAVQMVRLPQARMLDRMLARGQIDNAMLNEVVAVLVAFHRQAATGEGVDEHGSLDSISFNGEENFDQVRSSIHRGDCAAERAPVSRIQIDFLERRFHRALAESRALFERRVREGMIREGHGDLHAGNLCFTEKGVVAYDCIEFNRRFRCADVASEIAFLAMDLDLSGFPAFAGYLAQRYAQESGDPELLDLLDFYKEYRAVVRGKVALLTAAGPTLAPERRVELLEEAARHFQLAAGYELEPALILMCGLPGTGKSWLAARLAPMLRAILLRSDVRRKVLAGLEPQQRVQEGFGAGLYAAESKAKTYASLLDDARAQLEAGHAVLVDASFSRREQRAPFLEMARRPGRSAFVIEVVADPALVRRRFTRRAADPSAVSDAGLEVYERARADFEPPDELTEPRRIRSESGREDGPAAVSRVLDRMIEGQDRP